MKDLYLTNKNWQMAGQISRDIIESIDNQIGNNNNNRIFIINLPDNLKGAYIYRNGIYPAIQLFSAHKDTIKELNVASFQNLLSPQNQTKVTELEPYNYQVQLLDPGIYFMNVSIPLEQTFKIKTLPLKISILKLINLIKLKY